MTKGSSRRSSPLTYAAEALLCGVVALCPLALGGALSWVLWPLVLGTTLCLILVCLYAAREEVTVRLPFFGLLVGVAAVACLFQLIPLPNFLLSLLSPRAAELKQFAQIGRAHV